MNNPIVSDVWGGLPELCLLNDGVFQVKKTCDTVHGKNELFIAQSFSIEKKRACFLRVTCSCEHSWDLKMRVYATSNLTSNFSMIALVDPGVISNNYFIQKIEIALQAIQPVFDRSQ